MSSRFFGLIAVHFSFVIVLSGSFFSMTSFADEISVEQAASTVPQPGLIMQELVYRDAPFLQCHASTIEEISGGLIAAWFGGTREKNKDVGIWISRNHGKGWSNVVEVANGVQDESTRYPCWNPVLIHPKEGPLLLFYKVGPSPSSWWGMLITSTDGGKTWSQPSRLPDGILGPIKNKPIAIQDGALLCGSSSEHDGWRVHMEWSRDFGKTWQTSGPLNPGTKFGAIQPTILKHSDGLQILCRSRQGKIVESWSADNGRSWSELAETSLPNPNAGFDAVTLKNGRHLLVYNHTTRGRHMLNVAVSSDGKTWKAAMVLENQPGEFSYPAVIQTSDGLVHTTYTWKRRRVKHVVIDPAKLVLRNMPNGHWPK
jgi:predicted neuraminidase